MSSDSQPALRPGAELAVRCDARVAVLGVERVTDGLVWVGATALELKAGEVLELEIPIAGDARYRSKARVAIATQEHFGLRLTGDWDRHQGRHYVRVSTHGVHVNLVPVEPEKGESLDKLPMIDLSAGGMRVAERQGLDLEHVVLCEVELGGEPPLELLARVVRVETTDDSERRRRLVALEFLNVDDEQRSRLIAWVNRQQERRLCELRSRSRG